jgi:hypothetical protein
MPQTEPQMRRMYNELLPGDRVEIMHQVKVGQKIWDTQTVGTVVRKDRRRHGLHFARNRDDKVWSDILVLTRESGELTTVTIDEYTRIKRLTETVKS